MSVKFDASDAKVILDKLSNAPIAPGGYAHFIHVGTGPLLDVLEKRYFRDQMGQGIGSFKYLQAGYGGGKTQFILSLAERAQRNGWTWARSARSTRSWPSSDPSWRRSFPSTTIRLSTTMIAAS